jgi:hypothetical protein
VAAREYRENMPMFDATEETEEMGWMGWMGWMGEMSELLRMRDSAKKRRANTEDLDPLLRQDLSWEEYWRLGIEHLVRKAHEGSVCNVAGAGMARRASAMPGQEPLDPGSVLGGGQARSSVQGIAIGFG